MINPEHKDAGQRPVELARRQVNQFRSLDCYDIYEGTDGALVVTRAPRGESTIPAGTDVYRYTDQGGGIALIECDTRLVAVPPK